MEKTVALEASERFLKEELSMARQVAETVETRLGESMVVSEVCRLDNLVDSVRLSWFDLVGWRRAGGHVVRCNVSSRWLLLCVAPTRCSLRVAKVLLGGSILSLCRVAYLYLMVLGGEWGFSVSVHYGRACCSDEVFSQGCQRAERYYDRPVWRGDISTVQWLTENRRGWGIFVPLGIEPAQKQLPIATANSTTTMYLPHTRTPYPLRQYTTAPISTSAQTPQNPQSLNPPNSLRTQELSAQLAAREKEVGELRESLVTREDEMAKHVTGAQAAAGRAQQALRDATDLHEQEAAGLRTR